jgi:hypothetical protein
MKELKYVFENDKIKIEIKQDLVGWYLVAYLYPFHTPCCDYLQDTLEDIFEEAEERFGIKSSEFVLEGSSGSGM